MKLIAIGWIIHVQWRSFKLWDEWWWCGISPSIWICIDGDCMHRRWRKNAFFKFLGRPALDRLLTGRFVDSADIFLLSLPNTSHQLPPAGWKYIEALVALMPGMLAHLIFGWQLCKEKWINLLAWYESKSITSSIQELLIFSLLKTGSRFKMDGLLLELKALLQWKDKQDGTKIIK